MVTAIRICVNPDFLKNLTKSSLSAVNKSVLRYVDNSKDLPLYSKKPISVDLGIYSTIAHEYFTPNSGRCLQCE